MYQYDMAPKSQDRSVEQSQSFVIPFMMIPADGWCIPSDRELIFENLVRRTMSFCRAGGGRQR